MPLTDSEFSFFRDLAKTYTGIKIAEWKRNMVFRRISKRLRALGIDEVSDYCRYVSGENGYKELPLLINVLTTNKTSFFREEHHFHHLVAHALPSLMENCIALRSRRLRIWSAGCSSGEEAYSLAMTLHAAVPKLMHWDARILATDIDTEMIEEGQLGVYDAADVQSIPGNSWHRFVQPMLGDRSKVRMANELRSLIDFKAHNLVGRWPMQGPFDVVFCRNVVIYFDKPTQRILFDRFAEVMRDNSYLYIGHAESLFRVTQRFRVVGQGVYRKIC